MGVLIIAIAGILFIAVDIYAVIWLMRGRRRKAGAHGSLVIPGTIQIELPEGKVRVTYEEAKSSSVVINDNDFGVPAGLQVTTVKDVSPQPHNGVRPKKRRRP